MGIVIRSDFRRVVDRIANKYDDVAAEFWRNSANFRYGLDQKTVESKVGTEFSYAGDGKIRFVPANRVAAYHDAMPDNIFNIDLAEQTYNRFAQTAKIGKITRAIAKIANENAPYHPYFDFKRVLTDAEVETFVNRVKATDSNANCDKWLLIDGDDIVHYYHERNNHDLRDIGTLANSCMRYDYANDYLSVYGDNPQQIKMIALVDTDRDLLLARALVWRGRNEHDNNVWLLDRVYGSDSARIAARDLALALGIYVPSNERYGYVNDAGNHFERLTVKIANDLTEYETMPYMDTMRYLNYANNTLSNDTHGGYDAELTGTSGNDHYGFGHCRLTCDECNDRVAYDYAYHTDNGETLCQDCYASGCCTHCGEYFGSYDLTDSYCNDCYSDNHCQDCDTELTYYNRHSNGWCDDCYNACHCQECDDETTNLADGLCDDCNERNDRHNAMLVARNDGQPLPTRCLDCSSLLVNENRVGVIAQCQVCYARRHCARCSSSLALLADGYTYGDCTRCAPAPTCQRCGHETTPGHANDASLCQQCYEQRQVVNGQRSLLDLAWASYNDDVPYSVIVGVSAAMRRHNTYR